MKSQFAIFGLEHVSPPNPDNNKSGQPFLFRKYPDHFESVSEAHIELAIIMAGKSPFVHYKFSSYVVLEIIPLSENYKVERTDYAISEKK